jgi:hypothetical protein
MIMMACDRGANGEVISSSATHCPLRGPPRAAGSVALGYQLSAIGCWLVIADFFRSPSPISSFFHTYRSFLDMENQSLS